MAHGLRLTKVHRSHLYTNDRVQTFTRLSRSFLEADRAPGAGVRHRPRQGIPPGVARRLSPGNIRMAARRRRWTGVARRGMVKLPDAMWGERRRLLGEATFDSRSLILVRSARERSGQR
jgi:hypothetical protein